MSRLLRLVPVSLDADDLALLDWLGAALARRLPLVPLRGDSLPLDPGWLDAPRGQWSSNQLVDALVDRHPEGTEWTLALTAADLYAPGRDFVFGEATRGGAWAVVSLARLRPERDDDVTLRTRLLAEAIHELGHLAGLDHCPQPRCPMAYAHSLAAVDHKDTDLCSTCRHGVTNALDPIAPAG